MELVYNPERQVEIVKEVYEAKDAGRGNIKDLAERKYNISRKTFYNYKDYTEKLLNENGYKMRDIYDLSVDDLHLMVQGIYKKEKQDKNNVENTQNENDLMKKMYDDFNKRVKEENPDLKIEAENKKEKNSDVDILENDTKKSKPWIKWVIFGSIAILIVVIIFKMFSKKDTEKDDKTSDTSEQNNDEIVNTEDSNNSDVSTWRIF